MSPATSRVPKRPKWGGWTINLGHKLGSVTLILVIGIPVMILVLVLMVGWPPYTLKCRLH